MTATNAIHIQDARMVIVLGHGSAIASECYKQQNRCIHFDDILNDRYSRTNFRPGYGGMLCDEGKLK